MANKNNNEILENVVAVQDFSQMTPSKEILSDEEKVNQYGFVW